MTAKTWMTAAAIVMMGFVASTTTVRAECELSCGAECKQENAVCVGTANLDAKVSRQSCVADAADALLVCESDALDAKSDCVGMCGVDLKECSGGAKAALKACKENVKIELAGCVNEVETQADSDRASCAEDNADCLEGCIE